MSREGRAIGPFGIMGGPMQPQGHVQFVVNQIDYGMNPQAALDAPRFQWISGDRVEVELDVSPAIMQGLLARGHTVSPCVEFGAVPPRIGGFLGGGGLLGSGDFGKGQIIVRQASGVYVAGSDWRSDGCAVGF
jgi:gamma-glutamyltranspeptidase/glutathione hydrolase